MSVEVSKVLLSIIFIGLLFFLNYAIDTNVKTSVLKALALKERRQKGNALSLYCSDRHIKSFGKIDIRFRRKILQKCSVSLFNH